MTDETVQQVVAKVFNFDFSVDATLEICLSKKKNIYKPLEK